MASKKSFYIGTVNEFNGEYQYTFTFRFATSGKPECLIKRLAASWYGKENRCKHMESGSDSFFFNGGEVAVRPGSFHPVSESAFNELAMITDMTGE